MCEILIFGGTTEGRKLAEYCHENEIEAYVSVVSGYGKELLPESRYLHILSGGLTSAEMEAVMREKRISLVLDATHPFAALASANIKEACGRAGVEYLRVVRGEAVSYTQLRGGRHGGKLRHGRRADLSYAGGNTG